MFDGNTFLPVTGTPIRKMACMMRPFAEAEPVPFAVAILNAKSLTRSMSSRRKPNHEVLEEGRRARRKINALRGLRTHRVLRGSNGHGGRDHRVGMRNQQRKLPHVPRVRRAPLGAEPA